jgi:hypothetical protein
LNAEKIFWCHSKLLDPLSPVGNVMPAEEHRDAIYTIGVLMVSLAKDLDTIKDKMQRRAVKREKAHE